ncbi:MFS transporter [Bacillus sp. Bva_UNVM-123]|uniref:CynX/NimT family MFS transporter n=1 Tax=Bacillus sp. Bva_UNVM-123 TaxID=2829798 RepID=UPI00391EF8F3
MRSMRMILPITALFLASINLRPAITSVSPLLGTIQETLNMNGSVASLLTSLPVLCMGFFAPAAVHLSRRWSIERTIAYCLLLIGIATAARYFIHSSWLMLATAFLAGIGIAIIGPLLSGFIKQNFANPTAIVGVYSMALVIGAALGSAFAVPLLTVFNHSWQSSVASWSILAFIALFFWLKPIQKEQKLADQVEPQRKLENRRMNLPLKNKRAWLLTAFFGMMAFIFYSITAWLAPMVEEFGYDKHTAGMILTLFTLVQIPVSFVIPILVSRFQHRVVWLIGCSVMELVGLLLLQFSVSPWLACIFLGIGAGGLFPIALMLPIEESSSMEEASSLSAMTQSGGYIFASLGPFFVGLIHDYAGSFPPAIMALTVIVSVMILLQLKIGNKKKKQLHSSETTTA